MNPSSGSIGVLPAALVGKTAWPWISKSLPLQPFMPNGNEWPKISIVTPSFNQGQFLEEAIRSILLQNYPNLEYIIIDGGSSDESVGIIKKYEPWISYWVSEKDNGQAHAINKGLERCTGDIFNWINSDDYLTEGALKIIAEKISDFDVLAGSVINFTDANKNLVHSANLSVKKMMRGDTSVIYQQPGTWLYLDKLRHVGCLNESLHFCFDWLLVINYLNRFPNVKYTTEALANFRLHNQSKTIGNGLDFRMERLQISLNLMYRKDLFEKYFYESIVCIHKYLWIEEVDRIRSIPRSATTRVKYIIFALFRNLFTYPYRYAFGVIRKLIFNS
jgi:glycosyltransferase involved in cell wall biosynthesis